MSTQRALRILSLSLTFALCASTLFGCGARTSDEPLPTASRSHDQNAEIDSESHFLALCAGDCGDGFRCVCGVCTQLCTDTEECSELGESIECVPPTPANPSSCAGQVVHKVCDQHCETSDDCGPGVMCSGGACRQAPPADPACPALQTPACNEAEELRSELDEQGCLALSCIASSICRLPFWEPDAPRCTPDDIPSYWFNAAAGRCEVQYTGGCGYTENAFTSDQECWDSCAPEYGGRCFETWNARWQDAEFTPSALLPADPIALSHAQADALVQREYTATLTYPDQTQTELTLSLANATAYWVTRRDAASDGTLLVPNPGEIQCPNAIIVEAEAHFATADGRFDETWPRLQLALGQRSAAAGLALGLADDWTLAHDAQALLAGSYHPELTGEQCVLGSTLQLTLVDGALSGSLSHRLLDLPCSEVTSTTPIGRPTLSDPQPMLPVTPSGPVWNSVVQEPIAQFCVGASPNTEGADELAANNDADRDLYDDPEPEALLFSEVLSDCSEMGFEHCTPEGLLTLDAAECIARASGFEEGLQAWETGLLLDDAVNAPVWRVHSLLKVDGASSSGDELTIDAVSGEILSSLGWEKIPKAAQ